MSLDSSVKKQKQSLATLLYSLVKVKAAFMQAVIADHPLYRSGNMRVFKYKGTYAHGLCAFIDNLWGLEELSNTEIHDLRVCLDRNRPARTSMHLLWFTGLHIDHELAVNERLAFLDSLIDKTKQEGLCKVS